MCVCLITLKNSKSGLRGEVQEQLFSYIFFSWTKERREIWENIFFLLGLQGVFQDLTFFFLGGIFFFLGQKKILPRGRPPPKHCT